MNQHEQPPIKEGDIIENLSIISMGKKGDGVGKINNFVVIVPNTQEGQSYNVKVTKVLQTVAFGVVNNE